MSGVWPTVIYLASSLGFVGLGLLVVDVRLSRRVSRLEARVDELELESSGRKLEPGASPDA